MKNNMNKVPKLLCHIHGVEIPEGDKHCWRCKTRGVSELNEMIDMEKPFKRLTIGKYLVLESVRFPGIKTVMN
jgi:hypothetical protein